MRKCTAPKGRIIQTILLAYALVQLGPSSPSRASPPAGVSEAEAACRSQMIEEFLNNQLDPAIAKAVASHPGAETDGFSEHLAAVRAQTRQAATNFEAEEITPAKVRTVLQLTTSNMAQYLDAFDAEVTRLQQDGRFNNAQIAERAWLHAMDLRDGGRIRTDPSRITAYKTQMMAFFVDFPLDEQDRALLSPDELTKGSGLLDFLSLNAIPGIRLPFYGVYRHEHLPGCISAGPRGRAVISWLIKSKPSDAIIGSLLLDGQQGDQHDQHTNGQPPLTFEHPHRPDEPMSLADHFADTFQQAAQASRVKRSANLDIDTARAEFFALYPDKPGVDAARTKFANLLTEVDLYYFSLYLQSGMSDAEVRRISAVDMATGGAYGHGIQRSAVGAFRRWVDVAREAMGAVPRDPSAGAIN